MAINPVFALLLLLASTADSTSTTLPDSQTGFQVKLKHVDWGRNYTKWELLQRGMIRGRKRIEKLYSMAVADTTVAGVAAPIHAGNGEFLMELAIGTPPKSYSAILDTGSDLIWTQCKPCHHCFPQSTPIFDPKNSSSFSLLSCSSDLCSALPTTSSCNDGNCEYLYTYGDYSSTQGVMATEMFTFGKTSLRGVGFGCGSDNEGSGFNQGGGLVGLGRGPLSLVSQLKEPKFSYCLTSIDSFKTSTLSMGSFVTTTTSDSTKITTTPLIKNPSSPSFYYLSLEGITVGDTFLPIKKPSLALKRDGSGGMIIDSGTTITYLEVSVFELVKKEFVRQVDLPVDESGQTGLDLCFTVPANAENIEVPKLIFHFQGADLDLPGENYIIGDSSGVACLAMGGSNGMSIFGNIQQQNIQVVHDLVKETISFVPTECDKL